MNHLLILGILLIILVLLRFQYRSYEGFESTSKSIVICKTDWCGHCKNAAPEFKKLLNASPITLKDGSKATVKILDGDKDKSEVDKYKIPGFPSILVVNGGQTTEYKGPRTHDDIIEFMNS